MNSAVPWLPSPFITCGLLAALLIPLALGLLGFASPRFRSPGVRLRAAVSSGLVVVAFGALFIYTLNLSLDACDVLAALSLIVASTLASFIAWSLIAWGFTINMLLELASVSRPLDEAAWVSLYTHGAGYAHLTDDRMAILFAARLVVHENGYYIATPAGKVFAIVIRLLRLSFGIYSADERAGL